MGGVSSFDGESASSLVEHDPKVKNKIAIIDCRKTFFIIYKFGVTIVIKSILNCILNKLLLVAFFPNIGKFL
ncbi:hypothetical protein D3C85_1794910 [compost metagenome]